MPDPSQPFMQYAPNLLAMTQNPLPQAGQDLGKGLMQGVQNFTNPYQALLQRFGIKPGAGGPALPSATVMPVGSFGAPQQPAQPPGQPAAVQRPGMPGQPMMPPGFTPNAPGLY